MIYRFKCNGYDAEFDDMKLCLRYSINDMNFLTTLEDISELEEKVNPEFVKIIRNMMSEDDRTRQLMKEMGY